MIHDMKLTEMPGHTLEKPSLNESGVAKHNLGESATPEELKAEETRLLSEWTANKYSRDRALAYDFVGNQLDMLMKDMRDGTTTHQESCEAVKDRFPKP